MLISITSCNLFFSPEGDTHPVNSETKNVVLVNSKPIGNSNFTVETNNGIRTIKSFDTTTGATSILGKNLARPTSENIEVTETIDPATGTVSVDSISLKSPKPY